MTSLNGKPKNQVVEENPDSGKYFNLINDIEFILYVSQSKQSINQNDCLTQVADQKVI